MMYFCAKRVSKIIVPPAQRNVTFLLHWNNFDQLWCHLQKALIRPNILHCTKTNKMREKYSNGDYYICIIQKERNQNNKRALNWIQIHLTFFVATCAEIVNAKRQHIFTNFDNCTKISCKNKCYFLSIWKQI